MHFCVEMAEVHSKTRARWMLFKHFGVTLGHIWKKNQKCVQMCTEIVVKMWPYINKKVWYTYCLNHFNPYHNQVPVNTYITRCQDNSSISGRLVTCTIAMNELGIFTNFPINDRHYLLINVVHIIVIFKFLSYGCVSQSTAVGCRSGQYLMACRFVWVRLAAFVSAARRAQLRQTSIYWFHK